MVTFEVRIGKSSGLKTQKKHFQLSNYIIIMWTPVQMFCSFSHWRWLSLAFVLLFFLQYEKLKWIFHILYEWLCQWNKNRRNVFLKTCGRPIRMGSQRRIRYSWILVCEQNGTEFHKCYEFRVNWKRKNGTVMKLFVGQTQQYFDLNFNSK